MSGKVHNASTTDALMALSVMIGMVRETTEMTAESGRWEGSPFERFIPAVKALTARLSLTEFELIEVATAMQKATAEGFGITLPPIQGGTPSNN